MIVSQARINANRLNAEKSSGPKTPEGKERSRANALKHGLCSSSVVPESLELIQQRSREFFDTLKPQNEIHTWMVEQVALCSIRIERCQRIERRVRDKIALRAEVVWDNDRRFEVEVVARSLAKDSSAAVEALSRTSHGCSWMISRWAMLAYAADTQPEGWTVEQTKLAFDLLATPHAFREGRKPGVLIDDEGRVIEGADDSATVARREIAKLKACRDEVADLDDVDRALASSDLTNEGDPELRRLRRYESTLHNRFRWSLKQIDIQSPYRCPDPTLRPNWVAQTETEPQAKVAEPVEVDLPTLEVVEPMIDLEPPALPESGQEQAGTATSSVRLDKKIRRSAARSDNRRKKADKLRA